MRQFGNILKFELKYYFKNKVFVGVTVLLVLLCAVVMFFPRISEVFQSSPDSSETRGRPVMLVKAEETQQADTVREAFATAFPRLRRTQHRCRHGNDRGANHRWECNVCFRAHFPHRLLLLCKFSFHVRHKYRSCPGGSQHLYWMNALVDSGISAEDAGEILNVEIESNVVNLGKDQFQNYFYTYIMIFALYMVILLYGQMVATNVATEKSSRAMELLITSARPSSMMFGKILASCLAGLIQLVAIFGSAFLFYNMNKAYWGESGIVQSIFNIPASLLVYMLVFFILGFFIYASLYGAIGSTATKVEDINTSVMPLTFLFVIGLIIVIYSISSRRRRQYSYDRLLLCALYFPHCYVCPDCHEQHGGVVLKLPSPSEF